MAFGICYSRPVLFLFFSRNACVLRSDWVGGCDGAAASTWARSFSHVSKDGYGIQQI